MTNQRKSFPLRVSREVYDEIKKWAEAEMRSVNGQIEYLLKEAIRRRRRETDDDNDGSERRTP